MYHFSFQLKNKFQKDVTVWEVNPFALLMQFTIFALLAKYCA